jgi:hypothetical protein
MLRQNIMEAAHLIMDVKQRKREGARVRYSPQGHAASDLFLILDSTSSQ